MTLPSAPGAVALRGRDRETAALDAVLATVRAGTGSVLVLRGEPGIGKTTLLDHAAARADGLRIARVSGVESEMELPFAGLEQLCGPFRAESRELPGPQRDALSVAFGLRAGPAPDPFLVGLAVLTLLAGAAEVRPLVCLVDDAQWLDRGTLRALAFAARRLRAEPVAMVFALRRPDGDEVGGGDGDADEAGELAGLPELAVGSLGGTDARALLASAAHAPLDPSVRDRIVAEARGNPLALLYLPQTLSPTEWAGGFWLPDSRPPASRVEDVLHGRFRALPRDSRRLLLTAAAEPAGNADVLWRAAALLGIPADAAGPAEAAELVEFDGTVRFRHPLVRSAVYRRAPAPERRAVHRALAEATDGDREPDRKAWHRAHGTLRPDESTARELERSAGRARGRGGASAAASFLRLAVGLTPDPAVRARRALDAAQAGIESGGAEQADTMLVTAGSSALDRLQRARLERLRARSVFARVRGGDAPRLLLDAALRLAPLDRDLARETMLEAVGAAVFAGRLSDGPGQREVAEAARAASTPATPEGTVGLLLDGMVSRILDGRATSAAALRGALRAVRRGYAGDAGDSDDAGDATDADRFRLRLAFRVSPEPLAPELWDDEAWEELADDGVRIARDAGALDILPIALTYQACIRLYTGEFDTASSMIDEATAISEAIGGVPMMHTSLVLAAWRAREPDARDLIEITLREVSARGEGRAVGLAHYATAVLHNGRGRYEAALEAAARACAYEDLGFFGWSLAELVEAAARSGRPESAAAALRELTAHTGVSGTHWALGVQDYARALLSEDRDAEALYRQAVAHLERSRIVLHLARARLLYGEWLRRRRRRQESRAQLRSAYEVFTRVGANGFAERARRELQATGETVGRRTDGTVAELTGQETQIAGLVTAGHTNAEIAAQLFISPRTVEWHLGNVFTKLGITSRRQLRSLPGASTRPHG
ncbi:ATP-binding protein [Actinacidiphila acidipaludis]|uniref:AAA family ATPase n=1 Tax=Actinacidiphila acidipaludis TaxID=2873382 RepID=A0ABS7Q526_9ACTN|nr:LuxR family transcriptional regulator [Streptomyces acidipaludis]MBY8878260.1 AAA family ATPase [Streptomyces acidipaludis]